MPAASGSAAFAPRFLHVRGGFMIHADCGWILRAKDRAGKKNPANGDHLPGQTDNNQDPNQAISTPAKSLDLVTFFENAVTNRLPTARTQRSQRRWFSPSTLGVLDDSAVKYVTRFVQWHTRARVVYSIAPRLTPGSDALLARSKHGPSRGDPFTAPGLRARTFSSPPPCRKNSPCHRGPSPVSLLPPADGPTCGAPCPGGS